MSELQLHGVRVRDTSFCMSSIHLVYVELLMPLMS